MITGRAAIVKPLNGEDAPIGVVTVTVRDPSGASAATEIDIGRAVGVPPLPIAAVTPVPLIATAVAPYRPPPEIVALIVAPGIARLGEIRVIKGVVAGPHWFVLNAMESTYQPTPE